MPKKSVCMSYTRRLVYPPITSSEPSGLTTGLSISNVETKLVMIKKKARGNLKPNSGAKARRKGHNFERSIRKKLLPLYPKCITTRMGSIHLDQLKIDLMNCHPWAMQLKAVEKGVYPEKILKEMPQDRSEYNLLVHKKKGYQPTVSMTWDDFYEILEMLVTNKIL